MIILTNKGNIDLNGLRLIGASSKRSNNEQIGFFGSGAKYAIAWLIRNEIFFQLWVDGEEIPITTKKTSMRGQEYEELMINGTETSITTEIGPKWEAWMAIRELYANAIDEKGEAAVTDEYGQFIEKDRTTFIIEEHEKLKEVLENQSYYFARDREVLFENNIIKVYQEHKRGAGLYINGILVSQPNTQEEGLGYEMKINPFLINEERTIIDDGSSWSLLLGGILSIDDPETVRVIARSSSVFAGRNNMSSMEYNVFNTYPRMSKIATGLSDKGIQLSSNLKDYQYIGIDPKLVSAEWRKYKCYTISQRERFLTVPMTVMGSNTLVDSLLLESIESHKWRRIDDQRLREKVSGSYSLLCELVPELEFSSSSITDFSIGDCMTPSTAIEEWKSRVWIARSFVLTSSTQEIMIKMFTYMMVNTGTYGEQIAAMLISDRIKNNNRASKT